MSRQTIRIGARGSRLSLAQSEGVRRAIARRLGDDNAAVVVAIVTTGDRIQDRTLADIGGKGLFTEEIEAALRDGRIDLAVHSLKDMPTAASPGLVISAVPERADPRDALVGIASLADLPHGARLGTASLRRQAQCLAERPDLRIGVMRGNVDSRLRKLDAGEADALMLAAAGLVRLDLEGRIGGWIDPLRAPPAPGQGALAIQTRYEDANAPWLAGLDHPPTGLCVAAERGALEALDGSCRTAIGAYATIEGDRLQLIVEALSVDGGRRVRREESVAAPSTAAGAAALGMHVGAAMRAVGGWAG
ncbi:MAG: hydroxymethylbilane synthase [Caulobacteraceae bacterium]